MFIFKWVKFLNKWNMQHIKKNAHLGSDLEYLEYIQALVVLKRSFDYTLILNSL